MKRLLCWLFGHEWWIRKSKPHLVRTCDRCHRGEAFGLGGWSEIF